MYRLLLFLKQVSVFVLFVLIEVMALRYYSSSSDYSKSKLVWAANITVGTISRQLYKVSSYFNLLNENKILNAELAQLRNRLDMLEDDASIFYSDAEQRYLYIDAKVVDNSVSKQRNYIIINKGLRDDVHEDMAVVAADNIVGYIVSVSNKYAIAMSVLNLDFKSSGLIKGEGYFGSLYWDGLDTEYITLTEVSRYASIQAGDTIVSTGYSTIFPAGIEIGTVESFELKNNTYYDIKVKIGINMSALNSVTLVSYLDSVEKQELLNSVQKD